MAVELTLTCTAEQQVLAHFGDETQPLIPPTPLANLARIEGDSNPYQLNPAGLGLLLYQAMGGPALIERLDQDDDNLLLLRTDEQTAAFPWEYAATPEGLFLVRRYGFLRLLPQAKKARPPKSGVLNFIVLAADPLVDQQGHPIRASSRFDPDPDPEATAPRLDLERELAEIQQILRASGKALIAGRIPPTQTHLRQALRRGPAVLHLSCHGTVIEQKTGQSVSFQPILL
jgi:hypothetical protein